MHLDGFFRDPPLLELPDLRELTRRIPAPTARNGRIRDMTKKISYIKRLRSAIAVFAATRPKTERDCEFGLGFQLGFS